MAGDKERKRLLALVQQAKKEDTFAFGHVMCVPDFAVTLDDLERWLKSGAQGKPRVTKFVDDSI